MLEIRKMLTSLANMCKKDPKKKELCKKRKNKLAKYILQTADYNTSRIQDNRYASVLLDLRNIDFDDSFLLRKGKQKYKIEKILGCGGQGCVYFAWDKDSKEHLILKEGNALENEVRILKLLNKASNAPFIPRFVELFREEDRSYLVTKPFYKSGDNKTPASDLTQVELTTKQKEKVYLNLLRAVKEIENLGVKHKDIKPENILVNDNQEVQIIDYGVACHRKDAKCEYGFTKGYQPEAYRQDKNAKFDDIEDLYSLVTVMRYIFRDIFRDKTRPQPTYRGDSFDEKIEDLTRRKAPLVDLYPLLRDYCNASQNCMNFFTLDDLIKVVEKLT